MNGRSLGTLLGTALLLGAAVAAFRRSPAIDTPAPSKSPVLSPAAVPVGASGAASASGPASAPLSLRLFTAIQVELSFRLEEKLRKEGARAVYGELLLEIEAAPKDFSERVRRAYLFRFLPALCFRDSSLEADVLKTLESHASTDADAYARFVASATLLDRSVLFTQDGPEEGFFFARISQRLPPDSAGLDQGTLGVCTRDFPRLSALLAEVYGREPAWENRQLIIQGLAEEKHPENLPFLAKAAVSDSDRDVRYWSIVGLSAAGASPQALEGLRRASDDADPRNRLAALSGLVELGACDDLLVSRLLTWPEKTSSLYSVLGDAFAATASATIAAHFRSALASPETDVRRLGLQGMLRSGNPVFLPDLEPALARESDPQLRLALEAAKKQLSTPPAPDPE